jgi:hypothetical protein
MCILPNFEKCDLSELKQNGKKGTKKSEAKTVDIVIPEHPLLENSI